MSLLMVSEKDTEHSNGIMEKSLKESGRKEQKTDSEYGSHLKEIITKEIGFSIVKMEKEYLNTVSVHTKENLLIF